MRLITINNGNIKVPIIKSATYIYNPQLSKAKQNRNRPFELIKYNENGKSDIYWLDSRRSAKVEMNKALLYDYLPNVDEDIKVSIIPIESDCWKCNKKITAIAGVLLECQNRKYSEFFDFPLLIDVFLERDDFVDCSKKYNIGKIKKRYSKTVQDSYLSNGCYICDSIYGSFYLKEELLEYQVHDELPKSICDMTMIYGELQKYLDGHLFFSENDSKNRCDDGIDDDVVYEIEDQSNYSNSTKKLETIEDFNTIQDDRNEIALQMLLDKRSLTSKQNDIIGRMKDYYINSTKGIQQENLSDGFLILHEEDDFQLIGYKKELVAIANVEPFFVAYTYIFDKFVKIIVNRSMGMTKLLSIEHINEQVNMFK